MFQTFPGLFEAHGVGAICGQNSKIELVLDFYLYATITPPGNLIKANIFAVPTHPIDQRMGIYRESEYGECQVCLAKTKGWKDRVIDECVIYSTQFQVG